MVGRMAVQRVERMAEKRVAQRVDSMAEHWESL
jgi:hypothetical protein